MKAALGCLADMLPIPATAMLATMAFVMFASDKVDVGCALIAEIICLWAMEILMYEHVEMIVKSECREAFDAAQPGGEPFGQEMLCEVRRRVRQRYDQDRPRFFDCTYEHLLGLAGILTEECKVWWSDPFELPDGGTP